MILLSVAITLLLLNNYILYHQFSKYIAGAGTINISSNTSSIVLFSSKVYSSMIFNDINIFSSVSMPVIP